MESSSNIFDNKEYQKKLSLSKMLRHGVIMDVTNVEEAKIAEDAGAISVMALERVPSDIRRDGGVARMSDPDMIYKIKQAVSIPVMAKARIGHIVEAEILQSLDIDFVDESEVLTPADNTNHIYKHNYKIPFVCGAKTLEEAIRRVGEGAVLIRSKGEAGTGDISQAVDHLRTIFGQIRSLFGLSENEIMAKSKDMGAPFEIVWQIAKSGEFPTPIFSAGGVASPADAALMIKLGAESVFVGSGVFKAENPKKVAKAIVSAVAFYDNPEKLADISKNLGLAMESINTQSLRDSDKYSKRGW